MDKRQLNRIQVDKRQVDRKTRKRWSREQETSAQGNKRWVDRRQADRSNLPSTLCRLSYSDEQHLTNFKKLKRTPIPDRLLPEYFTINREPNHTQQYIPPARPPPSAHSTIRMECRLSSPPPVTHAYKEADSNVNTHT